VHKEEVIMSKLLHKGHMSCLSSSFRYTPATHTNIANTFARIKRELREQGGSAPGRVALAAVPQGRPLPLEKVQAAWRFLRAGGLRSMPRLSPSSALSDA
jgi:hypothetical protein